MIKTIVENVQTIRWYHASIIIQGKHIYLLKKSKFGINPNKYVKNVKRMRTEKSYQEIKQITH